LLELKTAFPNAAFVIEGYVDPRGPGEHSSKLIRSRRRRQAQHPTGLARDTRQLPEPFTLEAKRERLLIPPAIGT